MPTGFGRLVGSHSADDGNIGLSVSFTTTVDVPDGEHIVVGVGWFANNANPVTATLAASGLIFRQDSPTAISTLDATPPASGKYRSAQFSARGPAPSGTVITATFSDSAWTRQIGGFTLTGVDDQNWASGSGSGESTTAHWQADLTTLGPEGTVVATAWVDRITALTPDSGFTQAFALTAATDGSTMVMVYQANVAEGAYSPGGTFGATPDVVTIAASAGYAAQPPAWSIHRSATGHGGSETSDVVPMDPSDSHLFPTVTTTQAAAGRVEYVLVYVRNDEAVGLDVSVFVQVQAPGSQQIAVGVATQASGVTVPATAGATVAPAGVTFSTPSTVGAAVDLGTIPVGESRGLWVRRTVPSGVALSTSNPWKLGWGITPQ